MSRLAYPYLRPDPSTVEVEPWTLNIGGDTVPLPESIDDWDYNLDLRLERDLRIDAERIRYQCRLPSDVPLAICVVWRSTGSGLFGRAAFEVLKSNDLVDHTLDITIAGSDVGGTLDVDTMVVLPSTHDNADTLAPRRAGSVLWQHRTTVRLQGDASQFPIAVVDFESSSLPDGAGWHLEISGSMEAAAMGSLLLLINERHKTVADAFGNAGKPRNADQLVLSAVYADVARTMVEYALAHEEFVDEADFDEESLGEMLLDVFRQIFGGRTIKDIRLRIRENPSLIATEVQAATEIFG